MKMAFLNSNSSSESTQNFKNRSDFFKHLNHFSKKSDKDRKIRNNVLSLYFEIQKNLKFQTLQKP